MPPTRIFLDWNRPLLPAAARTLIDRYASDGVADLRGVTVVLPGGRARRRLLELLLDEAETRGLTLVPPASTTVGGLADVLHVGHRPLAEPATARRAWSLALREVGQDQLRLVFPRIPGRSDVAEWDRMAELLEALHESVAAEGHRFSDVAPVCRSGGMYDDGERWQVMARVQERYLRRLNEASLDDRYEVRIRAASDGVERFEGDLWLVSVVEFPTVTRRLLEASGAHVHVLVHAPEELADAAAEPAPFDDFGIPSADYWQAAPVPVRDDVLRVVDRPVDQADAVLEFLDGLGGRYAADEVVVAVHPESDVVPFLEQRLEARGAVPRYAAGTPLPRTSPLRLLEAVADYVDGREYRALAALLRHPDAGPLIAPSADVPTRVEGIDAADAYFGEHLPWRLEGRLPRGERDGASLPPLVRVLERSGPLARLDGQKRLSEWMPFVRDVLLVAYGERSLDRSSLEDRHLLEVLARVRAAATALATLPAPLDETCSAAAAIRSLLLELRGEALPPDPRRDAVELLDWLEVPLDDAPVVVVTGFNEGLLPESVTGHAFLPDTLRSRLGLMDNRRRAARDAYRLTTVMHAKTSVCLIAGRRSSQGDPLRPSRLMFRVPEEEVAARVLAFFDAAGGAHGAHSTTGRPTLGALGLEPAARSAFTVPPEPTLELAFEEVPTRLRVTDFKAILEDPYRFVLERVYHLEAVDDEAREMDPMVFGTLAHEVLQRFGAMAVAEPPAVDASDADDVRRALSGLLEEIAAERFGSIALPAVAVQIAQLEARLSAFADKQAEWAAKGWRIVAVERQPEGDGVPFEVDGTPMLLRGRIDRIDHNPETGAWAVLDYKTGNKAESPEKTHQKGKGDAQRWVDLQLPLYRWLLRGIADAHGNRLVGEDVIRAEKLRLGYIVLPKDTRETAFSLANWTEAGFETADEAAREAVATVREQTVVFDPARTKVQRSGTDPLELLLARGWQADGGDGGDEDEEDADDASGSGGSRAGGSR